MKTNQRYSYIDFLRAVAILVIIITHVFQYHLTSPLTTFIWNYSHFAVVLFVFCSVSVLLPSFEKMEKTISSIFFWYKKRLMRLLVPFYLYLIAHGALVLLLPSIFTGNGLIFTPAFIFRSVTLTGGIDLNWLVLLFVGLALLFPAIYEISMRKFWTVIYCFIATLFCIATLFLSQLHNYYRIVMFIAWSFIALISILIAQKKIKPFHVFLVSAIIFCTFPILLSSPPPILPPLSSSLLLSSNLIVHKYPPDLYYLSYATMMSMALYFVSNAHIWENTLIKRVYIFMSKHSYEIFFIHYIVLDASLRVPMNVSVHFAVVLSITLLISYILSFRPRSFTSFRMT